MRVLPYIIALAIVAGALTLLMQTEKENPTHADARQATAALDDKPSAKPAGQRTYYVDAEAGRDSHSGLSETTPWKTLGAIRRASLSPGDQVLLRRGQVWRETLKLSQSGREGQPIVVGAYGAGDAPAIRGSDTFDDPDAWHPDGATRWYLLGLAEDPGMLLHDGTFGRRRNDLAGLTDDWDFYHDAARRRLYVQCPENPAQRATRIEVPVREFVVGPVSEDHITLRELDLGHGRTITLLAWDGDQLTVENSRFSASPGNHIQFQKGSNDGRVLGCHFDTWNLANGLAYAIQVIAEQSGPVDISDCIFEASVQGGGDDHTAIMNDFDGWVRTVRNCQFNGNGGFLADEGVVIWRLAKNADQVTIEGNRFTDLGGTAVMIQELGHYGATPVVQVVRNRIANVCLGDDLDKEGIRARLFDASATVTIAYNLVNGTASGKHPHVGLGVQEAAGLTIANNLIRGADTGIDLKREIRGARLRNNLVLDNRASGIAIGATARDIDSDYNGFFGNRDAPMVGKSPGPNSILADPGLSEDFVPHADSPCIDGGDVVPGFQMDLEGKKVPVGAAPDIGPVEQPS